MNISIGLQLYTLREETEKDFIGTLEKVVEIGYKGVEFAGYGGISCEKMKTVLERLGLKAIGSHVAMDTLESGLDEAIYYNLTIGCPNIVLPCPKCETIDDFFNAFTTYESIGKRCKEKGLQFCYHNHADEFNTREGEYFLDILFKRTDKDLVKAEIDTFWVQYAGIDPVQYIKKYSGRCPLLHIKDMKDMVGKKYTEIGKGIIDIRGITEVAADIGAEWLIVEQDECEGFALDSVRISYENLKRILL